MNILNVCKELKKIKKTNITLDGNLQLLDFISEEAIDCDEEVSSVKKIKNFKEFVEIIKTSGIEDVSTYNLTYEKYETFKDKADFIVLNTLELCPESNIVTALLDSNGSEILKVTELIRNLFKGKIKIVTDKEHKLQIEKVFSSITDKEILVVPQRYGWIGEKYLKKKLFKDSENILMEQAINLFYISQLINYGEIKEYILSVQGKLLNKNGNFMIKGNRSYMDIIEALGGFKEEPSMIICGGKLKGHNLYSLKEKLKTGDFSLYFLGKDEVLLEKEKNCIRCGRCSDICPMNLLPLKLNETAVNGEYKGFKKLKGLDCVECGLCGYICPSKRHLVQSIKTAKRFVLTSN